MSKTHAFLKRSVLLNVAKAAINGFIILNLLAKCYSLSRALEILSQYLVLRTDILKKTVPECTCLKGKTPYCQNSIMNAS